MALKKTEVIKHSAAIQMSNRVTLLERRTWNILLAEAFDNLLDKSEHEVSEKDLLDALQIKTRNREHLKEMLRRLRRTEIEWNVLDKDKVEEWGVTGLLAEGVIKAGKVRYSFGPNLAKKLHNPRMYARISLSIQSKFDSKHALALYELMLDYFDQQRRQGETPWIEVAQYRNLLGVNNGEYEDFKHLNKRCIKEPLKEINRKSNLWGEVEYKRQTRRVTAMKFRITPNKEPAVQLIEAKHPELPAPPGVEYPGVYKRLIAYFEQSAVDARDLIDKYDAEYITGNLDELELRIKSGKAQPRSLGAYTRKILAQDIRRQTSLFTVEQEQLKAERQAKKEAAALKESEEAGQAIEIAKAYDNFFASLTKKDQQEIDAECPNRLSKFVKQKYNEVIRKNGDIRKNMMVSSGLKDARNQILEERYPQELQEQMIKIKKKRPR